jgi:NAD(P)-dependent dehydrogenase (short-subunit alcohol dehydrogenase family)
MNLRHKVALIAGGARIGITVAEELAREGCHVALTYRNSKKSADEAAKKVAIMGTRALTVQANLTDEADVKRAIQSIKKEFGRLDILINMASVYEKTPARTLSEKVWHENVAPNLKTAFLTVLYATPLLSKNGGRVVNFADWVSASGRPRYKDYIPYYTAKTAVIGLTQAQALELAPEILVNAVAPGPILPPAGSSKKEQDEVVKVTPLKRWGGAEEIAKAVVFLCKTDFVTGECLRVDGGRHLF